MSWHRPLGAGCFIRDSHNVSHRRSASVGTRTAQALSGADAGPVRPCHYVRRSMGLMPPATFSRAFNVDADTRSHAYDARYATGRDVSGNDKTNHRRYFGPRELRHSCLTAELRNP